MLSMRASRVMFGRDFYFFIIPLAALGVGIGGAYTYLSWKRTSLRHMLLWPACLYAVVVPVTFIIAHYSGYVAKDDLLPWSILFFSASFLCYVLSGIILSFTMRHVGRCIPLLYAVDLIGVSAGVFIAILLLNTVGYEYTIFLLCVSALLPVFFFYLYIAPSRAVYAYVAGVAILLVILGGHAFSGRAFALHCPESSPRYTMSNAYSHIEVLSHELSPFLEFGTYDAQSVGPIEVYRLDVDCGSFVTTVIRFESREDVAFLTQSLRSIPLAFKRYLDHEIASVFVKGSGGGIDVIRSQLFETSHIDAVEINPAILETAELFSLPHTYPHAADNVSLYRSDARRFLEEHDERYDVIFDTKSSIWGSEPFISGSPDYSVTMESVALTLEHLNPGGILVLSSTDSSSQTIQIKAAFALKSIGLDPSGRIVRIMGNSGQEDLLLIRKEPFSPSERSLLNQLSADRGFPVVSYLVQDELGGTLSADDLRVITDDRPFTRIGRELELFFLHGRMPEVFLFLSGAGVVACLMLFALPILREPGLRTQKQLRALLAVGGFFACIGFGFMMFEIAVIQKLFFFIADPAYGVGVVLTALLFWGGIGSLTTLGQSEARILTIAGVSMAAFLCVLMAAYFFLDAFMHYFLAYSFPVRVLLTILLLAVPGLTLGTFFPIGAQLIEHRSATFVSWAWAIDGVAGVAGGLAAHGIAREWGLQWTLLIIGIAYILAGICMWAGWGGARNVRPYGSGEASASLRN